MKSGVLSTDILLSFCRKGIQVHGPAIVSNKKVLRVIWFSYVCTYFLVHIFHFLRLNGVTIVN
jgi:hypothetical protein